MAEQPRESSTECIECGKPTLNQNRKCDACQPTILDAPMGAGGAEEIPTCRLHRSEPLDHEGLCMACAWEVEEEHEFERLCRLKGVPYESLGLAPTDVERRPPSEPVADEYRADLENLEEENAYHLGRGYGNA